MVRPRADAVVVEDDEVVEEGVTWEVDKRKMMLDVPFHVEVEEGVEVCDDEWHDDYYDDYYYDYCCCCCYCYDQVAEVVVESNDYDDVVGVDVVDDDGGVVDDGVVEVDDEDDDYYDYDVVINVVVVDVQPLEDLHYYGDYDDSLDPLKLDHIDERNYSDYYCYSSYSYDDDDDDDNGYYYYDDDFDVEVEVEDENWVMSDYNEEDDWSTPFGVDPLDSSFLFSYLSIYLFMYVFPSLYKPTLTHKLSLVLFPLK